MVSFLITVFSISNKFKSSTVSNTKDAELHKIVNFNDLLYIVFIAIILISAV